jgi:hypothetical protein
MLGEHMKAENERVRGEVDREMEMWLIERETERMEKEIEESRKRFQRMVQKKVNACVII